MRPRAQVLREQQRRDSRPDRYLPASLHLAFARESCKVRHQVRWKLLGRATSARSGRLRAPRGQAQARNTCSHSHDSRYRQDRNDITKKVRGIHALQHQRSHGSDNPVVDRQMGTRPTTNEGQSALQDPGRALCIVPRTCPTHIETVRRAALTYTTALVAYLKGLECVAPVNLQCRKCQLRTNRTPT